MIERPKTSFFFEEDKDLFAFLYFKTKIIRVTCKDKPQVIFENNEEQKLGKVKALRYVDQSAGSMNWWRIDGYFYYVIRDVAA